VLPQLPWRGSRTRFLRLRPCLFRDAPPSLTRHPRGVAPPLPRAPGAARGTGRGVCGLGGPTTHPPPHCDVGLRPPGTVIRDTEHGPFGGYGSVSLWEGPGSRRGFGKGLGAASDPLRGFRWGVQPVTKRRDSLPVLPGGSHVESPTEERSSDRTRASTGARVSLGVRPGARVWKRRGVSEAFAFGSVGFVSVVSVQFLDERKGRRPAAPGWRARLRRG